MIETIQLFFKNHQNRILIGVLILIAIFTHREWFSLDSILFNGDWRNRSDEATKEILNWGRGMWIGFYNLGEPNIQPFSNIQTLLWGIIGDYQLAVKITLLWPIAIGSLLSSYFYIKYLTKNSIVAFLSALFYGFTSYIIIKSSAHLPIAFVYAIAPFILLSFEYLLTKKTILSILIFSITYVIGCIYELRIMYILSWVLIFYFLFFHVKNWKNHIKSFLIVGILILLLSSFFLFPLFFLDKEMIKGIANRGLWGNDFFPIENAISLFQWSWTGSSPSIEFIKQPILWYYWITPILGIIPLLFIKTFNKKNRRHIVFFAILLSIGILLSKQSDAPFESFYLWMYQNFPGFNLFRLANKFYIILSLGYLGLISYGLLFIFSISTNTVIKTATFLFFFCYFLINTYPIITNQFGTLFESRIKPSEYYILDEMIKKDNDEYFRTLWIPFYSQWGYYDNKHPKIAMWHVMNKSFSNHDQLSPFSKLPISLKTFKDPQLYTSVLNQSFSKKLLEDMKVKYIILPKKLKKTEENIFPYSGERDAYEKALDEISYLKKISIGDLDIYKYEKKSQYIEVFDTLYEIDDIKNLSEIENITNKNTKNYGIVYSDSLKNNKIPSLLIGKLFNDIEIKEDRIIIPSTILSKITEDSTLLNNSIKKSIEYKREIESITFSFENTLKENILFSQQKKEKPFIKITPLQNNFNYFIEYLDQITSINDIKGFIGEAKENEFIKIFSGQTHSEIFSKKELINKKVQDCWNYDKNGNISLEIKDNIIQLKTIKHKACLSQSIKVIPSSEYIISMEYKSKNNSIAGYHIGINDENKITKQLLPTNNWESIYQKISIPSDVEKISFFIYSYESNKIDVNIAEYKNIIIQKVKKDAEFSIPSFNKNNWSNLGKIKKNFLPFFTYKETINHIKNPSFNEGLWNKKVGDCRNYDDNPSIGMNLTNDNALQLSALRHNACTSTDITITPDTSYLLEFDYKSPTLSNAGYYIGFNNKDKTKQEERLISNNQWTHFSKKIKTPDGADLIKLYIYSYQANNINNIVHYDNFKLTKLPNEVNNYYYYSKNKYYTTKEPKSITFTNIHPSLKTISIKGASSSFYISLSESFHKQWEIKFTQSYKKNISFLKLFFLDEKIDNKYHFPMNNVANGWLINTNEYCEQKDLCTKNKDGTYDINLIIEFSPNKWLGIGFIISLLTLFSITLLLIIKWKSSKK